MLEKDLHEKLADYVCDRVSLHGFQDWFVPETWPARHSGTPSELELIREIDLRLAEYTNGHLSEGELKERLLRILISVENLGSNTGSNVEIIDQPEMRIRSFRIEPVMESESQIPLGA